MRRLRLILATLLFLQPLAALAVPIFPDVPEGSPFQADIEMLVRAGVVHGNPDGTFAPDKTVNRAEMLKMLYLATDRTPSADAKGCFKDVVTGSWYEPYVCDAALAEHRFVQGYNDGTFRPNAPVSRVEALKMIFEIFELPAPSITSADQEIIKFVDISVSAWYARYLFAAYHEKILPIPGMGNSATFTPDKALFRKEAASYIAGALRADIEISQQSSSSSSVSSAVSSTSSMEGPVEVSKQFPFTDSGQFDKKIPKVYAFSLTETETTARFIADITGAIEADINCQLFLLNKDGFTDEYFSGVEDGQSCVIKATLKAGSYQLRIQPTSANAYFSVKAEASTSDGNDGFSDAVPLPKNAARTGVFTPYDVYDWYTFTIETQIYAYIEVASTGAIGCTIYTPPEVDQFGFEEPECNKYFLFEPGTYTLAITHGSPLLKQQTYTVKFR